MSLCIAFIVIFVMPTLTRWELYECTIKGEENYADKMSENDAEELPRGYEGEPDMDKARRNHVGTIQPALHSDLCVDRTDVTEIATAYAVISRMQAGEENAIETR
jgi:hypothetical protein